MGRTRRPIALGVAGLVAIVVLTVATGIVRVGNGAVTSTADVRQAAVDTSLAAAADAIIARDPAAWQTALPAENAATDSSWREVYAGLTRYRWKSLRFTAERIPHGGGTYRVQALGVLAGDSEYLAAERILEFSVSPRGTRLTTDRTPETSARDYLLAFTHPVVMRRDHLVVVGDRAQLRWIRRFAGADEQAHLVVSRLRLDKARLELRTLVAVCASVAQTGLASGNHRRLGAGALAFSINRCVYAPATRIRGQAELVPDIVRHELAHALDPLWHYSEHFPGILSEGLAMRAEGGHRYGMLRTELTRGNHVLPLAKALVLEDIWKRQTELQVDLAYLEGGALILYLEKRWGLGDARRFTWAVAESDLTPAGIEQACVLALGIKWDTLYAGWKRFVRTLP
jgi:hypothetical protein